jgi:hypothetical protein
MPISQFLGNSKFDPETKRIMGLAFEMTRLALGVPDRGDIANELIAKRIIELAKAGCMSSEHVGQLAWQFKRMSGSSGLKVQAAIAC